MHCHAEKCVCKPCEAGGRLTIVNPEPILRLRVTDVPPRDITGGEAHPEYFQFQIRVPGGETFYCIAEEFGGVVQAGQQDLVAEFRIAAWRDALLAELTRAEGELPPSDGYYDIRCQAIDENGFASDPSPSTRIKLSLSPTVAPKISVEAVPVTIVA